MFFETGIIKCLSEGLSIRIVNIKGVVSHVKGASAADTDGQSEEGPDTMTDESADRPSGHNVIVSASAG